MTGNQELYIQTPPLIEEAPLDKNADLLPEISATAEGQQAPAQAAPSASEHAGEQKALETDCYFMDKALEQARIAATLDEVPIGAVVVKDGSLIAAAYNRREIDHDPAGHAEFLAIKQAAQRLGAWRLSGCTVYVTLEPCLMCAGLMYQARIDRCVFGAFDTKAGALGSLYKINADERLNHVFEVTSGVRQEESVTLLKQFFQSKRARNKARKLQARRTDKHTP